jgi:uncharacterized membrane protein AbrB (regulator of aidB expression)
MTFPIRSVGQIAAFLIVSILVTAAGLGLTGLSAHGPSGYLYAAYILILPILVGLRLFEHHETGLAVLSFLGILQLAYCLTIYALAKWIISQSRSPETTTTTK